jgi:tRNA(Ile)-lysidine synthase
MRQKFQDHIAQHFPEVSGKKILLAISGGVDSMVLLHLCQEAKLDIAVAHCNFQLRAAESDGDEALVTNYCQQHAIPLYIERWDTATVAKEHHLSIQMAARNLRYDWFTQLVEEHHFDLVCTAHHLDDSLETFLINLTRGSGIEGLVGIPQKKGVFRRPLLGFSRSEIETFAQNEDLKWREDSSNASTKYLRNKLRHEVIPILKEINPSLLTSFDATVSHLKQTQTIAQEAASQVFQKISTQHKDHVALDCDALLQYANYQAYLYYGLQEYGFTDWNAIYELVHAQTGKYVESPTHKVLKNRSQVLIYPLSTEEETHIYTIEEGQTEVNFPLKLSLCNTNHNTVANANCIFVDADTLHYPLVLRKWKEGDVFYPLGMQGKKKVSKYFKDEKLSALDKANTWLLCSDNQIVWVVGKRADERFKTTEQTTHTLQIQLQE